MNEDSTLRINTCEKLEKSIEQLFEKSKKVKAYASADMFFVVEDRKSYTLREYIQKVIGEMQNHE